MQGKRGAIGSFAETLDFDHGTTSNNAAVDQHSYWNHMRNPAENRMPDYMLSQSDMNIAVMNSTSHELPNLNRWCLGEPSSSNTQGEVCGDERKAEFGWSSSVSTCAMPGPRFEDRRYELNSNLSVDNNVSPVFTHDSNSDAIPQNLNLDAGIVGHSGNTSQAMEYPSTYKVIGNEQIRPATASDSFLLPEGSTGPSVGENDGRPGSLESHRLSRKRKRTEGNAGQSSAGGSSSYPRHAVSSARPGFSSRCNAGSSMGTYASSEEANPRLGLGGREVISDCLLDSSVAGSSQRSHRNFRVRINTLNQHNSIPPPAFPSVRTVRDTSVLSSQLSPLPVDPAFDLRPTTVVNNMNFQSQPVVIHAPNLPQNVQSLRWSGGSISRAGSSSTSGVYGDRDALSEELGSRGLARNTLDHPIFIPATEIGNAVAHPPSRSSNGRNYNVAGNVASTSQTGSGSAVHPPTAPTWLSHHNSPQQHQRRLSEIVRQSLLSSTGTDSGGPSSNYLPLRVGHPSSQEMVFASGAGNQGHHRSHPRSASWLERQNDVGRYSIRGLAAASEGNNRLVSEIRNVLGLMRRGENLRFEDVMILDQSMFFGIADMHDRHRDMRLDVDNMSYEELLALEERIGSVSTGLSEETISSGLKHKKFFVPVGLQCEAEPCCICQEEYNEGEVLGTLQCGHGFHGKCIKQWLMHKNLCPICKTTGLAT